jgi:phage repressor protein C with HTH and peptisase S24 domain
MSEESDRLRIAREQAGYATATAAAEAMGVKGPTYTHHENGTNGYSRSAARYAKFFRVSLDWLVTGRGQMRNSTVPLVGVVGAGAVVIPIQSDENAQPLDFLDYPHADAVWALRVRGDSQYPRYLDGEFVLFQREPTPLKSVTGKYCVVDTSDGRRLVKLVRVGTRKGVFTLYSHNAAPEEDVSLVSAHLVTGTLT